MRRRFSWQLSRANAEPLDRTDDYPAHDRWAGTVSLRIPSSPGDGRSARPPQRPLGLRMLCHASDAVPGTQIFPYAEVGDLHLVRGRGRWARDREARRGAARLPSCRRRDHRRRRPERRDVCRGSLLAGLRHAGRRIEVDFNRSESTESLRALIREAVVAAADEGEVVISAHAASFALAGRDRISRARDGVGRDAPARFTKEERRRPEDRRQAPE